LRRNLASVPSVSRPKTVTTDNESIRPKTEKAGGENPASPGTKPASTAPTGLDESSESEATASAAPPEGSPESLRAERDKLREQLLRTAADFDNFRKRTRRDLDEARQRGKDELVRELLPVFDNLARALQTTGGVGDIGSVIEGVRMVLKLFEDTAERIGLLRVPAMGQRFDPAVHEAIQQRETDEQPPGTVIAEIAAGYRFGERLVRPAMVVVARKSAAPKREPSKPSGAPDPLAAGEGETTRSQSAPAESVKPVASGVPDARPSQRPSATSGASGTTTDGNAAPNDLDKGK
jgi:molecular chaperone GrpE